MAGPVTGGRIGPALRDLIADTLTRHRQASLPIEAVHRSLSFTAKVEELEKEFAADHRELWGDIATNPDLDPLARAVFQRMTGPKHQVNIVFQIFGAVLGVFQIAGAA